MNFHNIVKDDMRNGVGLRVTLFVSGCCHNCFGCQNRQTWDPKSGVLFDEDAFAELREKLNKDYIDGITLSGGDPLFKDNRIEIGKIISYAKSIGKTVWLYTGYTLEKDEDGGFFFTNHFGDWFSFPQLELIDVIVDGPFDIELLDQSYHWAGSTNQRVIDVKETLKQDKIILILSGRPFPNESVQHLLPEKIGLDTDYFQEYT